MPQTVPPYYYVRYEGSDKPGELVYGVTFTAWFHKLTWTAQADLESGLAYFVIQRDGKFLAKVPESDEHTQGRPLFQSLYIGDTPRQPLPEMTFTDATAHDGCKHSYRVIAVNTVGLESS